MNPFDDLLRLPEEAVPDRAEVVRGIPRHSRQTVLQLDGPGCIRHIALVTRDSMIGTGLVRSPAATSTEP